MNFLSSLCFGNILYTQTSCYDKKLKPKMTSVAQIQYGITGLADVNITWIVYSNQYQKETLNGNFGSSWSSKQVINNEDQTSIMFKANGLSYK